MKARYLDLSEYYEWNLFVDKSPQGSIYTKTWYLNSFDAIYRILAVFNDNEILGGVVLTKNEIGLFSNPMLSKYLGVLFFPFDGNEYMKESKRRNVLKALIPFLKKIRTFNYTFSTEFNSYLPFYWENFRDTTHYTYQIDLLNNDKESLFRGLYSKLKTEIMYAEKNNYRLVDSVAFNDFYFVLEKTFKKQGGDAPWKYDKLEQYVNILKKTKNIELNGVYCNSSNKLIAVAGLLYDDRSCYLIFNGVDYENIKRGANEFLIFYSIVSMLKKSNRFDFEGSMIDSIESFYRKFGGERVSFMHIYNNNLLNYFFAKLRMLYRRVKYKK